MAASPSGTTVPAYPFISDASGGVWGLVPTQNSGMQVCHNGTPMTGTAYVTQIAYVNGKVYQQNRTGAWWVRSGSAWVSTTNPLPAPTQPTVWSGSAMPDAMLQMTAQAAVSGPPGAREFSSGFSPTAFD